MKNDSSNISSSRVGVLKDSWFAPRGENNGKAAISGVTRLDRLSDGG